MINCMVGTDSADSQLSLYMGLWGSVGVLTFNFAQYHEQTVWMCYDMV
jgi:hypothetical protein